MNETRETLSSFSARKAAAFSAYTFNSRADLSRFRQVRPLPAFSSCERASATSESMHAPALCFLLLFPSISVVRFSTFQPLKRRRLRVAGLSMFTRATCSKQLALITAAPNRRVKFSQVEPATSAMTFARRYADAIGRDK